MTSDKGNPSRLHPWITQQRNLKPVRTPTGHVVREELRVINGQSVMVKICSPGPVAMKPSDTSVLADFDLCGEDSRVRHVQVRRDSHRVRRVVTVPRYGK